MIPVKNICDLQISPNRIFGNGEILSYDVDIRLKLSSSDLNVFMDLLHTLGWVK